MSDSSSLLNKRDFCEVCGKGRIFDDSRKIIKSGNCDKFKTTLNHRIIIVNPENSDIGGFRVELVREDNVVEFIAYGPFFVSFGRIGFALGV